jgi:hypothetical protein
MIKGLLDPLKIFYRVNGEIVAFHNNQDNGFIQLWADKVYIVGTFRGDGEVEHHVQSTRFQKLKAALERQGDVAGVNAASWSRASASSIDRPCHAPDAHFIKKGGYASTGTLTRRWSLKAVVLKTRETSREMSRFFFITTISVSGNR